jgi:hypothetical protein
MAPLMKGYRYHVLRRTYGGVVQRCVLIYSEHRRPQEQRAADKHLCIQSTADIKAFKQLCRAAFACEADARHALGTFAQRVHATALCGVTIRPMLPYCMRDRRGQRTPPEGSVLNVS